MGFLINLVTFLFFFNLQESVLQKYGIHKTRFDSIFAGPMPDFSPRIKKPVKHKQESIAKFLTGDVSKHRVFEKPDPLRKVNDSGMVGKKSKKQKSVFTICIFLLYHFILEVT